MLRRPPQDFWADTLHAVRVGALVLFLLLVVVAAVYAAPEIKHGVMG